MHKFRYYFLLLSTMIFCSISIYGQTAAEAIVNKSYLVNRFNHLVISNDEIRYYTEGPDGSKLLFESGYKVYRESYYDILETKSDRYALFYTLDSILLHNLRTGERIWGTDYSNGGLSISMESHLIAFTKVFSSSFLKEGGIEYRASNLSNYDLSSQWVEGESGAGIGTTLSFEFSDSTHVILFVNGFFMPSNLNFYKYNNRVKRVKIKLLDEKEEYIFNVKDFGGFQELILPKQGKIFELTILEVYRGTKFNDTCISGLFTDLNRALTFGDRD